MGDPLLDLTPSGSLLVGVQTTLNASRDGCDWSPVLGGGSLVRHRRRVREVRPVDGRRARRRLRRGGAAYRLARSTDEGATWSTAGPNVAADNVYTIDVDPRDARRLYATAIVDNVGQWLTSTDAGAT